MSAEKRQLEGRIEQMTAQSKAEGRKAFVAYLMAGEPDVDGTYLMAMAAIRGGASLIELGVPYSDPAADGPVIRRAGARALEKQTGMDDVFKLAGRIRAADSNIPLAIMLYFNLVFRYGVSEFFQSCADHGLDGCIIPDLPLEEQDEIRGPARAAGIRVIQLVTPVSGERMVPICERAEGFLYCVSSLGTTGERVGVSPGLEDFLDRLGTLTAVPRFVGFGIATPDQAEQINRYADGVIVGSALIRTIEEGMLAGKDTLVIARMIEQQVRAFCRPLTGADRGGRKAGLKI